MNKKNLLISLSALFFHVTFTYTNIHDHVPDPTTAALELTSTKTPIAEEPLELILPGEQRDVPATTPLPDDSTTPQNYSADNTPTDSPEEDSPDQTHQGEILIDTVVYVIGTETKTMLITLSQTKLPALDGSPRTEDDLINEDLLFAETQRTQPVSDEDETDKRIKDLLKEHNISEDQLKEIIRAAGFTYEEGRAQIGIMTAVGRLLSYIRYQVETMFIPEEEIKQYYHQNPIFQPAYYYIERALVPFSSTITIDEQRANLRFLSLREISQLNWSRPFKITREELPDAKKTILDAKIGTISEPYKAENGFEILRVKTKQEKIAVPLEQRKNEINAVLRKQQYDKRMNELIARLRDEASIIKL